MMSLSVDNPQIPALLATPLATVLGGPAESPVEYRGAAAVAAFSNSGDELAAMLTNAGVFDLGWRSFLRCAGRDRVRWLNGMCTNSVKGLEENEGCYAFVLNAQGRIQGDIDVYRLAQQPDALWIETDRAQVAPLVAFLRRYIIMDQVTLEHEEGWTTVGVAGPGAAEKIDAVGLASAEISPVHLRETSWRGHSVVLVASNSPLVPRYEIWIEASAALELWNALVGAGAVPCGVTAIEQLRILEGTPAYGVDIADRDLPQETNQMRALNFTKGCYLGQEIVERIRSRGNVHRTLSGFLLPGGAATEKTQLMVDDKPVGEITSAARISLPAMGERVFALGRIRREALESKIVTTDGTLALPCSLPFSWNANAVEP